MINLRGHVVPVYDLKVHLAWHPGKEPSRGSSVMIVETERGNDTQVTGLVVDRVSDVLEFSPEEVQPRRS